MTSSYEPSAEAEDIAAEAEEQTAEPAQEPVEAPGEPAQEPEVPEVPEPAPEPAEPAERREDLRHDPEATAPSHPATEADQDNGDATEQDVTDDGQERGTDGDVGGAVRE